MDTSLLTLRGHEDPVLSVAFGGDGKRIVSGSSDNTVRVWDAEAGSEPLLTLRGHEREVRSVAFSGDGKRIVSGSEDRAVRVWDVSPTDVELARLTATASFIAAGRIDDTGALVRLSPPELREQWRKAQGDW